MTASPTNNPAAGALPSSAPGDATGRLSLALADDMRVKLLYDVAYSAALEDFSTFLRTELEIIFRTPLMMIARKGH